MVERVHAGAAALWLIGVSAPTSVVELAGIPLAVCFFVRAAANRRLWLAPLASPLFLLLMAWVAWQGMSLLWSRDVEHGLDEMDTARWAWSLWFVYPVIHRRRFLIAAYAAGVVIGQSTQLFSLLAPGFIWARAPHRYSGWWEPVAGGVILTSALGLHLPAAFLGQGRERLLGVGGAALSAIGIFLTGTRGAWLAAAGLLGLFGAFSLWRMGRRSPLPALVAVAVLLVGMGGAWALSGEAIRSRWARAVSEINRAVEAGDYTTDTGARLLMNLSAVRAFAENPIAGVGAGGFRPWMLEDLAERGIDSSAVHDHAHSAPLHIAATTGLIGLAITGAIFMTALRRARAWIREGPAGGWGSYDAGPLVAMTGMALVSATNSIQLINVCAAHLLVLFTLCPPRPRRDP